MRFNQLSHGAKLLGGTQLFMHTQQLSIGNQVTRMKKKVAKKSWSSTVGLEPTTLRLRVSCSTD